MSELNKLFDGRLINGYKIIDTLGSGSFTDNFIVVKDNET